MSVESLNSLVTAAIWRAEQLAELGVGSVRGAWLEVSELEAKLAEALGPDGPEGRIARRGAVRAALKAGDSFRAEELSERYFAEEGSSPDLCDGVANLLADDELQLSAKFPFATKVHTPSAIRDLARSIARAGPFGLAA